MVDIAQQIGPDTATPFRRQTSLRTLDRLPMVRLTNHTTSKGRLPMTQFRHAILRLAIVGGLAAAAATATAQDQDIYDAIDCGQWTKNSDGTWDTGPKAEILGSRRRFANLRHVNLADFYVNGVDISAWLNAKCANKCQKFLGIVDLCSGG